MMKKEHMFNMLVKNTTPIFYDCEFEVKNHGQIIIPISIAFCQLNEFGKKLYLINSEYDWNKTENQWLKENVKPTIDYIKTNGNVNYLSDDVKSNLYMDVCGLDKWKKYIDYYLKSFNKQIQLWGYFCQFDHVVLSSIYGNMVDFPPYLNMYSCDIQQLLFMYDLTSEQLIKNNQHEHDCLADACWTRDLFNNFVDYFSTEGD